MRLCFFGAGAWGTALAAHAAGKHPTVLYVRDAAQCARMRSSGLNQRYLPGVLLPAALQVTSVLDEAFAALDLLLIATPIAGLREAVGLAKSYGIRHVVWLCKGFEADSALLPHEVVAELAPELLGAALSGPSFALEVAQQQPTALTCASADQALTERVIEALHGDALRVYSSGDVTGVEVGGGVKNVLAIATGICDGLQLGLNARAALMTRGLSEMTRLGAALGADANTLYGLSGVGDLILTCTGSLSRNRQVGVALGQGQSLAAILQQLGHVAEGVRCARAVRQRARLLGVEMPITEAVCEVLFDARPAKDAAAILLARAPRAER